MSEGFKIGDRVRVTGDTAFSGHRFDDNTEGVIGFDREDDYRIGRQYYVRGFDGEGWWVGVDDLEIASPGNHTLVLGALSLTLDLDLPDEIKISFLKALVNTL